MAKIGVSVKIDVSKIDKSRMFKGEKGTYLDAVVFIDMDNKDQHGNSGMITQDWKDAPKGQTPILGNVKVFWSDAGQQKQDYRAHSGSNQKNPAYVESQEPKFTEYDDSIPF
jgi:hypothetical protein